MLPRLICLADGRNAFVRPRRIPLVSALALALSDVALEPADYRLDAKHHPHVRDVALPHGWSSMGRS